MTDTNNDLDDSIYSKIWRRGRVFRVVFSLFSLGVTYVCMRQVGTLMEVPEFGAIYTANILLHEAGHYAAFRWCGYTATMVFLPILGGGTTSFAPQMEERTPGWQHVVISLAGPLVNAIFVAGGLLYLYHTAGRPLVAVVFVLSNSLLGLTNILPYSTSDGAQTLALIYHKCPQWQRRCLHAMVSLIALSTLAVAGLVVRDVVTALGAIAWIFSLSRIKKTLAALDVVVQRPLGCITRCIFVMMYCALTCLFIFATRVRLA